MQFLKVYQIIYKAEQRALCEDEYLTYFNFDCTPYFENSVISELINKGEHNDAEYFGVVSYKLREKIGSVMKERWKSIPEIANGSGEKFTPAKFEAALMSEQPDVLSFQQHIGHDPIMVAENFHPGFRTYWGKIMQEIGMPWKPTHLKDVVYCNYFVAISEVYDRYVREMLMPAMKVMDSMPELWKNSNYPQRLPADLSEKWSVPNYTFHPFICERFFSWYMHVNQLNCKHF